MTARGDSHLQVAVHALRVSDLVEVLQQSTAQALPLALGPSAQQEHVDVAPVLLQEAISVELLLYMQYA